MTPINFKANYIKSVDIQKYDGEKYNPCKASFVALNHADDKKVVDEIAKTWDTPLAHGMKISFTLPKEKLYAVTLQKKDFNSLDSSKILGMVCYYDRRKQHIGEIEYLQVHPENISESYGENIKTRLLKKIKNIFMKDTNSKPQKPYKHIGKSLVNSIINLYSEQPIILIPFDKAIRFYKKLGFVHKGQYMVRYPN